MRTKSSCQKSNWRHLEMVIMKQNVVKIKLSSFLWDFVLWCHSLFPFLCHYCYLIVDKSVSAFTREDTITAT